MGRQIILGGVTFSTPGLPSFILAQVLAGTVSTTFSGLAAGSWDIAWHLDGTRAWLGGTNCILEYNVGAGTATVVAGGTGVPGGTDGTGTAARFGQPSAFVVDPTGTYLYIVDQSRNTLRRMTISGYVVTTVAGIDGTAGDANGTGTAASFRTPYGLAISPDNTALYVLSATPGRVAKVVIGTAVVTTVAATSGKGIVCSNAGDTLYLASDAPANAIQKVVISTGVVVTIAGSGTAGGADGTGTAATFNTPWGIEIDPTDSYLYVMDYGGNVLRRVALRDSNKVITVAGLYNTPGTADGTGNVARFTSPLGLQFRPATAKAGTDLYISGFGSKNIRKVI